MKSTTFFALLWILGSALSSAQDSSPTPAESYRVAADSVDQDLRTALDELSALRERIATEKAPLAVDTEKIAAELREMRRKADLARTSKDAAEAEFEKSDTDLRSWREEKAYIESLFTDFRRTWEANKLFATEADFSPLPAPGDAVAGSNLAKLVLEELNRGAALTTIPGEVVNDDGQLVAGTFVKAGPVHWFVSDEGNLAGLVGDAHDLRPRIVNRDLSADAVRSLIAGHTASLPFDPTLGSAVALSATKTDLITHVKQGGFWVYPIIFLAFLALVIAIAKWMQLSRIREFSSNAVQQIIRSVNEGKTAEAKATASTIRHPARQVLERGINMIEAKPETSRENVEEALFEEFLEASPRLHRGLPLIAIVSATAPLLGLLGTVTGMMETFRLITVFGSGDAKSLASGISEALITTEFGLIVAIPALIVHSLLSRKVQGIKSTVEITSLAFLNGIRNT